MLISPGRVSPHPHRELQRPSVGEVRSCPGRGKCLPFLFLPWGCSTFPSLARLRVILRRDRICCFSCVYAHRRPEPNQQPLRDLGILKPASLFKALCFQVPDMLVAWEDGWIRQVAVVTERWSQISYVTNIGSHPGKSGYS